VPQCLMLAAAAALFACGRRRPGPAGQSCSSRSLAAAGLLLLEWQGSRSAAWRLELLQFTKDHHIASQNADHTPPPPWTMVRYSSEGNTTSTSTVVHTRMTDHTTPAPAHKEMGALQVTVLAGISPQPGSLRFQMGTAADQIEAEDHVVTLHAVTHTTPDRPYR